MSTLRQNLADALTSGDIGETQDPSMTENYSVKANYYDSTLPVEPDRDEIAQDNAIGGYRGEDIPRPVEDGIGYSRDYEVNIRPITSGFILTVGCQTIAVESGSDVAKLIQIYLSGDKAIGDKWMKSDKIVQNFIKENLEVK